MASRRPHDGLFKLTFTDPETAAGELRSILPTAISDAIDWSTLRVEDGTLLAADLSERFADILYTVQLGQQGAWIYVLFEHQSTPDRMMVARALVSVARVWDRLLASERGLRSLPPVIPVLLSHAEGGWTSPRELSEVLDLGEGAYREAMLSLVPHMSLAVIDDLTLLDDDVLDARRLPAFAKLVLAVLRDVRGARDLAATLGQIHARWTTRLDRGDPRDERARNAVHAYTLRVRANDDQAAITGAMLAIEPEAEEVVMGTIREMEDQAEQRGQQRGEQRILTRQLTRRFGALDASSLGLLATADPASLERWAERVLTAATLAEVFEAD